MKKSWLGVAGCTALVFGLFACSGEDGADGINGKDGQNGLNGVSCEVAALKSGNGYKVLCDGDSVGVLLNGADGEDGKDGAKGDTGAAGKDGAKGDPGEKGSTGDDGTSCTVDTLAKQVGFKVLCDGDSVGVLLNGVPGESCTTSEADDGIAITCGSTTTIVKNGANGTSCTAEENATKTGFVLSCGGKVVGTILNGSNGVNGTSCTAEENATKTGFDLTCDGKKVGTILNGSNGANGKSCSAVVNNDGNFDLSCDGVAVGTIKNGANGTSCEAEKVTTADGRSGLEVTCGGTVVDTVWNGDKGETGAGCTISDDPDLDGVVNITCGETTTQIFKAMCGETPFDPKKQFCENRRLYDLCGGVAYDPSEYFCQDDYVYTLCKPDAMSNSRKYDPEKYVCSNGGRKPICGYNIVESGETYYSLYFTLLYTRIGNSILDSDGSTIKYIPGEKGQVVVPITYDLSKEFCKDDKVYNLCGVVYHEENGGWYEGGEDYDPETQICVNDVLLSRCGDYGYDSTMFFCEDGNVYNLCNGKKYDPETEACSNSKIMKICGREKNTYSSWTRDKYCESVPTASCFGSLMYFEDSDARFEWTYEDSVTFVTTYDSETQFCDTRDHQLYTYKAIKISTSQSQVWMTENLNYDVSGSILPDGDWSSFGRLYTWTAAMALDDKYLTEFASGTDAIKDEHQGVCPEGWHMPSEIEFLALRSAWTNVEELAENGDYLVSFKFKADTSAWDNANAKEATNVTGFSAMPVGFYVTTGTPGYSQTGLSFRMWLAGDKTTQQTYIDSGKDNPSAAYRFQTHKLNDVLGYNNDNSKSDYYAVRCVKNAD